MKRGEAAAEWQANLNRSLELQRVAVHVGDTRADDSLA
jgi:hypothetical protein